MLGKAIFLGSACAALMAAAMAPQSRASEPASVSPGDLVAARQGGMAMSVFTLARLSAAANADAPLTQAALPTKGLARFAQALPTLFAPETAGIEGTEALPAVWQDEEAFAARIAEYQAATAALADAARSDNREAFNTALASTKAACQACHDAFRAKPQG
ncbi:cytochrome c [Altererythrobacter litoralis]|uniref:Cytochrome c n=1 Tax=Altererythrobacter litoralis TaxID=3113904 RepID=A0ABU7GD98_9SPHN|nr:cytochrome c [Erythrobacteraceae bacterium 1XM1-14]